METVATIDALREIVKSWRDSGDRIALVPTMGNLHAGHLKLIEIAQGLASRVVASIFVNPAQFSEGEDYDEYPQSLETDSQKLCDKGVDLLFAPAIEEVYPENCCTYVEVEGLSNILCGEFRPTHFRGVSTVVCKLFNMVGPDMAVFGEKDFQQLTLIRAMVANLDIPVEIVSVPIIRERDGLAMSSRNMYLSIVERKKAAMLYRSLRDAEVAIKRGNNSLRQIEIQQCNWLKNLGFKLDYFSIRRINDLSVAEEGDRELIILVAVWLGAARLIDNLQLFVK